MGKIYLIGLAALVGLVGCKKPTPTEEEPPAKLQVQNFETTQDVSDPQDPKWHIEGDVVNIGEKRVHNVILKINDGCQGMEKNIKNGGDFDPGESEHFEFTCRMLIGPPYCCKEPFTWNLVWEE